MNELSIQAALAALSSLLSSPHFASQLSECGGEDDAFEALIHNTSLDAWRIADVFVAVTYTQGQTPSPTPEPLPSSTHGSAPASHPQSNSLLAETPAGNLPSSAGQGPSRKASGASPAPSVALGSSLYHTLQLLLPSDQQALLLALEALNTAATGKTCRTPQAPTSSAPVASPPPSDALRRAKALLRAALRKLDPAGAATRSKD